MQLVTIESHKGEGIFPKFQQGTKVILKTPCQHYPNWYTCEIEHHQTYVPIHFIKQNKLICDYNPTELVINKNETVKLLELHYQWALVEKDEQIGWLPCEILKSHL